jgi:hypothetical protein
MGYKNRTHNHGFPDQPSKLLSLIERGIRSGQSSNRPSNFYNPKPLIKNPYKHDRVG